MTTKTITITKFAYDALAREKRKDESFSKLALRLTSNRGTLQECRGLWKFSKDDIKIFDKIGKSWALSDQELKRRLGNK